jgi:hypothetical protein
MVMNLIPSSELLGYFRPPAAQALLFFALKA